jgi:hypothetical protein
MTRRNDGDPEGSRVGSWCTGSGSTGSPAIARVRHPSHGSPDATIARRAGARCRRAQPPRRTRIPERLRHPAASRTSGSRRRRVASGVLPPRGRSRELGAGGPVVRRRAPTARRWGHRRPPQGTGVRRRAPSTPQGTGVRRRAPSTPQGTIDAQGAPSSAAGHRPFSAPGVRPPFLGRARPPFAGSSHPQRAHPGTALDLDPIRRRGEVGR